MVKIIVEGKDDSEFFKKFIYHLIKNNEIDKINPAAAIMHMGGKSKLLNDQDPKYLKNITPQIEQGKLEKVLFIFDCDFIDNDHQCGGMENSIQCFKRLIKKLNWDIEIDFYIFDKNLDYFLISTIKNKHCYPYFNSLINCLSLENIKPNKKPIANLYRDLYPYPNFYFQGDEFIPIRDKLVKLFS